MTTEPRKVSHRLHIPGYLWEELRTVARRERIEGGTLSVAILATALGHAQALAEGRFGLSKADEELVVDGALTLLSRALALPVRVDATYVAAEIASHLEVHQATFLEWVRRGYLPAQRAEDDTRAYIRGFDLLVLLMEQSLLVLRPLAAARGAPSVATGTRRGSTRARYCSPSEGRTTSGPGHRRPNEGQSGRSCNGAKARKCTQEQTLHTRSSARSASSMISLAVMGWISASLRRAA